MIEKPSLQSFSINNQRSKINNSKKSKKQKASTARSCL